MSLPGGQEETVGKNIFHGFFSFGFNLSNRVSVTSQVN
jgi:hypothetical protein